MRQAVGDKEAEILEGHILMISDPYMQGDMDKIIEGGSWPKTRCRRFREAGRMYEAGETS